MGYRPKKWPSYALTVLENSVALTIDTDRKIREMQQAILANNSTLAAVILSDIRQNNQKIRENLIRSKTGEYENPA